MTALGVVAPVGRFRSAIGELPLSARQSAEIAGAVVALGGAAGWVDAARDAAASGALAIVVADPEAVRASALLRLMETVHVPVVIERPLLRSDVAQAAFEGRGGAAPRALAADGGATRARTSAVTRDALGWLRVLAGEPLQVVRAEGAFALLETASGLAATLSIVTSARPGGGWIRAEALGETRTEVRVEAAEVRVTTSTRAGVLLAPTRFESSERLALRRAIEALDTPAAPRDLDELLADTSLTELLHPPQP